MKDTKASLDCLFAHGQISLKSYMRRLGHLGEKGGIPMTERFTASTKSDYNYIPAEGVNLGICPDCGCYVFDRDKHVKFHENLRLEGMK